VFRIPILLLVSFWSVPKAVQGSLFEEDFLLRSVPTGLTMVPDVALTELVANAWDAGATKVEISIPAKHDDWLVVKDNGAGLTRVEFGTRWIRGPRRGRVSHGSRCDVHE
jgi:hypothetical protein